MAISLAMLQVSILDMSARLQPHLPGANELKSILWHENILILLESQLNIILYGLVDKDKWAMVL